MKLAIPAHWRTTQGQIIAASVKKIERQEENEEEEEEGLYFPGVEFAYTVNGKRYTSKQAVGRPNNTKEKVNHILTHYQIGSEVLVYYDPQKPSHARFSME